MNLTNNDHHELMALIVHELRSPAVVVSGYLRLLLTKGARGLRAPERRMIEEANRSCMRLLHMMEELGDLARLESSEVIRSPSQVQIFSLCDEVVRMVAPAEGAAVTFLCSDIDRSSIVQGDAGRLKQALGAFVAATRRECGAEPLEAYGFVSRKHVTPHAVIAIGGSGIGDRYDEVLDNQEIPFDRWRGGTGMSLPIACRIVEAHGGRIWSLPSDPHAACAISLPVAPS